MIISILVPTNDGPDSHNVQGDEMVARSWVKYLSRDPRVTHVAINKKTAHVFISFAATAALETEALRVLYLQNAFSDPPWTGGTRGVFSAVRQHYDQFIFPSPGLRDVCCDGLVLQFAVDHEVYYPREPAAAPPVVFVGNNIRDQETTERYILACRDQGLAVFGNTASWNDPACRGKCSVEQEASMYTNAKVCLNAHIDEHLKYGSFNFRIFCAMACQGFVVSDWSPQLEAEFGDCMAFTDGGENLQRLVDHVLCNPHETQQKREAGRLRVLKHHTFAHRMTALVDWLETKL